MPPSHDITRRLRRVLSHLPHRPLSPPCPPRVHLPHPLRITLIMYAHQNIQHTLHRAATLPANLAGPPQDFAPSLASGSGHQSVSVPFACPTHPPNNSQGAANGTCGRACARAFQDSTDGSLTRAAKVCKPNPGVPDPLMPGLASLVPRAGKCGPRRSIRVTICAR